MMIADITFDLQTEFHTLKHFESIDSSIEKRLLDVGCTHDRVKAEREVLGSKFLTSFATSVEDLLARIADYPFISTRMCSFLGTACVS